MLSPRIGVFVSSQRKPRVGLQIGQFVLESLRRYQQTHANASDSETLKAAEFLLIDLGEISLPLFDECDIPFNIFRTEDYLHEHTKAWSRLISSYDAIVFVSPEYNCGYPASLKNAIDFLYNEWARKPAIIVGYGVHGAYKCNKHFREVVLGVRMRPTEHMVHLKFPTQEVTLKALKGQDLSKELGFDDSTGIVNKKSQSYELIWREERKTLSLAIGELFDLLDDKSTEK